MRLLYASEKMWGSLFKLGEQLLEEEYPDFVVHSDRANILDRFGHTDGAKEAAQTVLDEIEDSSYTGMEMEQREIQKAMKRIL